jgi:hypothetical protein
MGSLKITITIKKTSKLGVVVHTCNPSTWEAEAEESISSRPIWATYEDPV